MADWTTQLVVENKTNQDLLLSDHYICPKNRVDGSQKLFELVKRPPTRLFHQMDVMHWLGHKHVQMTEEYTRGTEAGMLHVMDGIKRYIWEKML
ncbi:hypothetical protein [Furfurilactobacillus curtus]|uniref:Integrase n=1 Tax=Furfurilactobacillus curtus TaxID=1746200 RepID=A0ABQ5JMP4_9LACO